MPHRALASLLAAAALAGASPALAFTQAGSGGAGLGSAPTSPTGTGGGGLAPTSPAPTSIPPPPGKHARGHWLTQSTVTEYWPAPEAWFTGALVSVPGLTTKHRIDWLYSAEGVSMQGEGLGLDGQLYHIDQLGNGGWVTAAGHPTSAADGFSAGSPFWRAGAFWRNRAGAVTFPLAAGGWSNGAPRKYVPLPGVTFATGPSLPLKYYQSIAVDPNVIPLGSRVYIPAYRHDGYGGWFIAQDTGGAINGRHVDVFRPPPPSPTDVGQYLTGQRIYVIKSSPRPGQ